MTCHFLLLYLDKTEVLLIGAKTITHNLLEYNLH